MSVKYGLADIQGNSFDKMTGKPFGDLKPMTSQVCFYFLRFWFKGYHKGWFKGWYKNAYPS